MAACRLSVLSWNPCSLVSPGRLEEISRAFSMLPLGILIGTRIPQGDIPMSQGVVGHHRYIHAGWGKTRHSNRSAGITFIMNKRWFKPRDVVYCDPGPPELAGRTGIVRLKSGRFDISLVAAYLPPRGKTPVGQWKQTVSKVIEWAQKQLKTLPVRTLPIVGCGLNDDMGLVREDGVESFVQSSAVGSPGMGSEGFSGRVWRQMLEAEHMVALSTFTAGGSATYFGENSKSRIDYIGATGHEGHLGLMQDIAHEG